MGPLKLPRVGLLFNHDWDAEAFARLGHQARFDSAGFDLLSFPSNAALVGFDLLRFAARQARRGQRRGWAAKRCRSKPTSAALLGKLSRSKPALSKRA